MANETDYYTNAYLVLEGYEKEMIPAPETKAVINFNPAGIPTMMPAPVKLAGIFDEAPSTKPVVAPKATDTTIETGGTSECEDSKTPGTPMGPGNGGY